MTQEEKIKHFFDVAMDDARKKNALLVDEYKKELESEYSGYVTKEEEKALIKYKVSKENLLREKNSEVSKKQIEFRREYADKQDELKRELYEAVVKKLEDYKKSEDYLKSLEKHIDAGKEFAGECQITFFVDASDSDKIEQLKEYAGTEVCLDDKALIGGIRAKVPEKNVLIDESFVARLNDVIEKFTI